MLALGALKSNTIGLSVSKSSKRIFHRRRNWISFSLVVKTDRIGTFEIDALRCVANVNETPDSNSCANAPTLKFMRRVAAKSEINIRKRK